MIMRITMAFNVTDEHDNDNEDDEFLELEPPLTFQ